MEGFRTLLASHGGLQGDALEQTAQRLLEHFTAQLLRNVARLESRQNNLSNLPSPSFAVSRTSHESWIGCYGEPPLHEMPGATTAFRFLKQRGVFIALG